MHVSRPMRADEARVLIVDDEPRVRELLMRVTQSLGFRSVAAWSGEEAVRLHDQTPFDIAILDFHLPRMNGLETLERLRKGAPEIQAIVLTGFGDIDVAKQAVHLDVVEFLIKPCQRGELEQALDRALRRKAKDAPAVLGASEVEESSPQGAVTLEESERNLILQSLVRNEGNRAAAARELGITRRTLHNKINTYQNQGFAIP